MAQEQTPADRTVDRRKLLRRAGTVAAGLAGAGVVGAVATNPANAADGGNLTLGAANEESTPTSLTNINTVATGATLTLGSQYVDTNTRASRTNTAHSRTVMITTSFLSPLRKRASTRQVHWE